MQRERVIAELKDIAYREREYLAEVTGEEPGYIAEVLYIAAEMLEPKKGHWITEKDRTYHWSCSNCGNVVGLAGVMGNYCEKCGAEMETLTIGQIFQGEQNDVC